jgi:hypothetical protein
MGIIDWVKETAKETINGVTEGVGREITMRVRQEVARIKKEIIRKLVAVELMMISGLLLLFALIFFMIDYLQISRSLTLLIVGVIMLITGLIINIRR